MRRLSMQAREVEHSAFMRMIPQGQTQRRLQQRHLPWKREVNARWGEIILESSCFIPVCLNCTEKPKTSKKQARARTKGDSSHGSAMLNPREHWSKSPRTFGTFLAQAPNKTICANERISPSTSQCTAAERSSASLTIVDVTCAFILLYTPDKHIRGIQRYLLLSYRPAVGSSQI